MLAAERVLQRYVRAMDERTPGALRDLISEDWTMVDHRRLPWDTLRGREEAAELNRSVFRVWAHARFRVDEVIALDEHAIAFLGAWHGPAKDGGGEAEIAAAFVWTVDRDRMVSMDIYELDDREEMLARFAHVTGVE